MNINITFLLLFVSINILAQRQFSVVCDQNESKLEVITMGDEQPFHKVIRDNFPNQRAAQAFLSENGNDISCGNRRANVPPPTTAGRKTTINQSAASASSPTGLRKGAVYYSRRFRIMGGISKMFALDQLYFENVENSTQTLGYDLGAELTFGSAVQGGFGIHYTSLFGQFEDLLLDLDFDSDNYYGSLSSLKGEVLIKTPFRIKPETWIIFDFGFGYYINPRLSLEEGIADDLFPLINDQFYSHRWGLGADIKGVNFELNGEIVYGISDDTDKEGFFVLKFMVGYAF